MSARSGDHVLCARTEFPDAHAWVLNHTFADYAEASEAIELPVDLEVDAAAEAEVPHNH